MDQVIATIGGTELSLGGLVVGFVALLAIAGTAAFVGRRSLSTGATAREELARLADAQAEQAGRLQSMIEMVGGRQGDLARAVSERLDGLGHRIGQSMNETTRNTQESLSKLHERLAVIDRAQSNITELSSQMVELQNVLANKQPRGAFGQARMEAQIDRLVAQSVANDLVDAGILAILNFSPAVLDVPDDVQVNNVDLAVELENLSYFIR